MTEWRAVLRRNMRCTRLWSALLGGAMVGVLVLYALYLALWRDASGPDFGELIARIGLGMFVTTSVVYSVDLALAIIGWGWIIGTLSRNWQWFQHMRIYCVTAITRRLPGTVWYMLGRIVLYERLQVARSVTALAGGVEFAAIILGGLLVALVTWPIVLSGRGINPLWFLLGLIPGGLILNPITLRRVLNRLNPQSAALDVRYRHLLGWVFLYAGIWCGGGVILFVLTTTIHPLPLALLPAMIGVWATAGLVATLLSFVPLGLGQELTLTALLSAYVGTPEAIVIALLMRGVLTINEALWALIAGLLGLTRLVRYPRVPAVPSADEALSDGKKPEEVYERPRIIPQK